ncbi:MAG: Xaa-Pro peptidase family protein, partial [Alphaproteobacteria bacterium]|nr:Xaa-Pro peptidase family protein [Alphaproteobacteria bacterium]
ICVGLENLYYLGGYDSWVGVNSLQAMIFTAGDDEPTLVVRNVDLPLATETTWLRDIRTYHLHLEDPAALIAEIIDEKGGSGSAIGIEAQSYALTWDWGRQLERALSPVPLVDVTTLLGDLRWIKSAEEIACMRRAAHHARNGLAAMRQSLKPGISEIALAAEIENALRRGGCDFWSIPIELASGSRSEGGHATPRNRVIEPGDLVHAEFAGVDQRYHAVAIATLPVGEVSGELLDLYDITRQSLDAGIRAIRPGVPVADIEEESLEPLRRAGLEDAAMMRFGYGIGIAYPPIWLETLQISRGIDQRMAPGMAFVLHACVTPPGSGDGVVLGGTWLLGEDGQEMLTGLGAVELGAEN